MIMADLWVIIGTDFSPISKNKEKIMSNNKKDLRF